MHATGVFVDIAANAAGNLAGRIGGVIQTKRCRGFGNGQIAHAGLHHGGAGGGIHRQNALEFTHHQQYAAGHRQGAARQTSAGTTRHHRHAQTQAGAQHLLHLQFGFRQHHHQRHLPESGQGIAFKRRHLGRADEHFHARPFLLQLLLQAGALAGIGAEIGGWVVHKIPNRKGLGGVKSCFRQP